MPAAIIVTNGPPQWTSVAGTSLQYAANSDAALFRDQAQGGKLYYLVSGRWFSAATLAGPWSFATTSLPADFARIPPNGPRGFVLVSVPGTPQAQEALLETQIPQQATLDRSTAKMTVVYAGEPVFAPIPGTTLAYATNTSFVVVRESASYYSCYQGAWFVAGGPSGPWVLTETVPASIYAIPPSSPVYPCTYVRVYASTPTSITYGYTPGYTMSYVSAGVVVYGTGYYYPPYIYPAYMPIYYPYPYSYAGATYYNPATGAWAHGGAIYGPWGGAAKGGSYYNPTTGTYARGGEIYGPNGGAGAFSAYNPTTGSYAHGSATWGPDGGTRQRELVQREHRPLRHDEPEQQPVRPLGLEHDLGTEPDRAHAKPGRLARQRRLVQLVVGRARRGLLRRRRQQGRRRAGRGRRRLRRRGRQRLQEDRQRLGEVHRHRRQRHLAAGRSAVGRAVADRQQLAEPVRRDAGPGQPGAFAEPLRRDAGRGSQADRRTCRARPSAAAATPSRSTRGQLENDHSARMGGQQRYQQFGAQRGSFGGGGGGRVRR